MKTPAVLTVAIVVLSLGSGCERARPAEPSEPAPAGGESPAAASASPGPTAHPEGLRRRDHGEGEERGHPPEVPIVEAVTVGGAPPEGLEVVDAAAIVERPEGWHGKQVSVRGRVNGYCHHRRAWFAVEVPGNPPRYLRFMATPAFAVPEGVMGALATVHGTVEIVELPRERIEHFEGEHRLGSGGGGEGTGPVRRPVVRAAGAVFEPAPAATER